MCSDVVIRAEKISKCYHIYEKPSHRLMQAIWRERRRYYREFWAVENISFEIRKGETVGIIGRNGAGKSTLLQMICGTLSPTQGDIVVNGKVAALLELGAGFNPEFTGRENVYLSGSLYGLSKSEIDARFSAIAAFADIGQFIEQPVKTYSSGMFVRLAFAVIAHVDADILIIDEALSVGDVFFQQKCMRLLDAFQKEGGTLLFVSHDMGAINALCTDAILLRRSAEKYSCDIGDAKSITALYLRELYAERGASSLPASAAPGAELQSRQIRELASADVSVVEDIAPARFHVSPFSADAGGFGTSQGRIVSAAFYSANGAKLNTFTSNEQVILVVEAQAAKGMNFPAIGFMIKNRNGQYVVTESTDSYLRDHGLTLEPNAEITAEFELRLPPLTRGEYTIDFAFAEGPGLDHVQHHWIHDGIAMTVLNENTMHGISGSILSAVKFIVT